MQWLICAKNAFKMVGFLAFSIAIIITNLLVAIVIIIISSNAIGIISIFLLDVPRMTLGSFCIAAQSSGESLAVRSKRWKHV
eukprot:scaffold263907_cov14-Prasinocladus_malaysianus.AAC.1